VLTGQRGQTQSCTLAWLSFHRSIVAN
jgi:hypothetical protein